MITPAVVDEHELADFRRRHLSPAALLRLVEEHVHVIAQVAVGVGKSHAVDQLLEAPALFEAFDRVLYAAPTWAILRERRALEKPGELEVAPMLVRSRPRERCGELDARWTELEHSACSALAKATLCGNCRHRRSEIDPCRWPDQFGESLERRLLLMPEQQLLLNRMMVPLLRTIGSAGRILVILDEAKLFDASFEVALERERLSDFQAVLEAIGRTSAQRAWASTIGRLLAGGDVHARLELPDQLHRDALEIQRTGLSMFGADFHNLAYDLSLLGASQAGERWIEGDTVRFLGRPLLRCHVLALSASLSPEYAGDRLGAGRIASPFSSTTFRHTGTRIINLRSRIGADRYFFKNRAQVLDTVALLLVRNIQRGQTTLLISKKKSKQLCAAYLERRLARWGYQVRFVCDKFDDLPAAPTPSVVPVIHYGTLGINCFSDYESAYCLNSYYVAPRTLSRAVQESSPKLQRVRMEIESGPERIRRPVIVEGGDPAGVVAKTAGYYLDKLELDPVVQAIGRVRYATRPREVLVFQMAELTPQVGPHEVVTSLAALRELLGMPTAQDFSARLEGAAFEEQVAAGRRIAEIAADAGVSERTVYRRLQAHRAATEPISFLSRGSVRLPASGSAAK